MSSVPWLLTVLCPSVYSLEGFAGFKSTYTVDVYNVSLRCHRNRARPKHYPRALISQAAEGDERQLAPFARDVTRP